jgi:hypothetical protein
LLRAFASDNKWLSAKMVEQKAPDRNSASSLDMPRNTLKTKGFTWEVKLRPKFPTGKQLFFPDFQAPDEDDGFATQADTKKNTPTNLIRFRKRESN